MANTNVKQTKTSRQPRQTRESAPVVEEPKQGVVSEPVEEEIEVLEPKVEKPEEPKAPEPKVKVEPKPETCTNIHLIQKGEKYSVYRGTKKLTRALVSLEKARLIAAGYGENNPTIVK